MTYKPLGWNVTVPAGTYFLGDPCYACPNDHWHELLDSSGYFNTAPVGTADGHHVLGFGTKYGDGVYHDTDGHSYPVDAGLIGLAPLALFEGREKHNLSLLGRIITFTDPATCTADAASGLLTFGGTKIETDPADEDEDEDEEWGWDDEDPDGEQGNK